MPKYHSVSTIFALSLSLSLKRAELAAPILGAVVRRATEGVTRGRIRLLFFDLEMEYVGDLLLSESAVTPLVSCDCTQTQPKGSWSQKPRLEEIKSSHQDPRERRRLLFSDFCRSLPGFCRSL